ncbi:hypothetical protein [Kingella potus]|uniref:hypothetical protein n=1 Tax=Kingella potus TaxID=265175 RepID=UPI001FCFF721|nr:hypothetical protein [Kingella potus]UOO99970.1 hypothetical protein LVJ84_08015 [Kingella potus]
MDAFACFVEPDDLFFRLAGGFAFAAGAAFAAVFPACAAGCSCGAALSTSAFSGSAMMRSFGMGLGLSNIYYLWRYIGRDYTPVCPFAAVCAKAFYCRYS